MLRRGPSLLAASPLPLSRSRSPPCARCAQSGAAAACRCCDALPPDNAAEEASLLDEVVAPYSAYYGRVAARDALAAVDKALKKGA